MNIVSSVSGLIGSTPLFELTILEREFSLPARLAAKLEYVNLTGSAKDRVALFMLNDALKTGKLAPGGTVIEPTSGNTGIGLAAVGASMGLKVIIVMPDSMSAERQTAMRAYGAQVVLSPGSEGMAGAIRVAEKLRDETPGAYIPDQFSNPVNVQAHYETTGPELWRDTDGSVDAFVAGIGTGGTVTGTARYLKEQNPAVRVIGMEPASSPLLTKGEAGAHKIQGIGADFVPSILDRSVIDEIVTVTDEDAYKYTRLLCEKEGLLCGISSGAALCAALKVASREEMRGKLVTVLLPDTGSRYFSCDLF